MQNRNLLKTVLRAGWFFSALVFQSDVRAQGTGERVHELFPLGDTNSMPAASKWVLDSLGPKGQGSVQSVFMVVCQKTMTKGTGFLLDTGYLITNEHVIRGCEIGDIVVLSYAGTPT